MLLLFTVSSGENIPVMKMQIEQRVDVDASRQVLEISLSISLSYYMLCVLIMPLLPVGSSGSIRSISQPPTAA